MTRVAIACLLAMPLATGCSLINSTASFGEPDGSTDAGIRDSSVDASRADASDGAAIDSGPPLCPTDCAWGCVDGVCDPPVDLALGLNVSCARRASGSVYCWGTPVGDGTSEPRTIPTRVRGPGPVDEISSSSDHVCARSGSTVFCWGRNDEGQIGDGSFMERRIAVPVLGLPGAATAIATGDTSSYAVVDGVVYGWGFGAFGGDGMRAEPEPIPGIGSVALVGAGGVSACALTTSGELLCWGAIAASAAPTPIGSTRFDQLAPGDRHFCALGSEGLACFGSNTYGELGDGSVDARDEPVAVVGLPSEPTKAVAGNAHTCALVAEQVWCWGRSHRGQVGDGTTASQSRPVLVLEDAVDVGAGHAHTCAITSDGNVWCWGVNGSGQVGNGEIGVDALEPTQVLLPSP